MGLWGRSQQDRAIGVSYDSTYVRWVELIRDTKGSIRIGDHGQVALPDNAFDSLGMKSSQDVYHALTPLQKYHNDPVYVAIPHHDMRYTRTTIPLPRKRRKLEKHIDLELTSHLLRQKNMVLEDMICEYDITGTTENRMDITMNCFRKSRIRGLKRLTHQLGLGEVTFTSAHKHLAKFLQYAEHNAISMVYVGHDYTTVMIMAEGVTVDQRTLPIGRATLVDVIADTLSIDDIEAHKIITRYGVLRSHREPAVYRALERMVREITDVVRTMASDWRTKPYATEFERTPLQHVYILGYGSQIHGLARMVARHTGLIADPVIPWLSLDYYRDAIPPIDAHEVLLFTEALAVARDGLDS